MREMTNKRWEKNKSHWKSTLDAQNLKAQGAELELEQQLQLFETGDVRVALNKLEPWSGSLTLDLGGGLGLFAILMARRGARVVIVDLSIERLKIARQEAMKAGLEDRIHFVVGEAEFLPFSDRIFERQVSKSVLIHTRRDKVAAELERIAAHRCRSIFIEPSVYNPFVNLYRSTFAPKVWTEITDYFSRSILKDFIASFSDSTTCQVKSMYFLSFFAMPFNFILRSARVFRFFEKRLLSIDRFLFRLLPTLRSMNWFYIIYIVFEFDEK